MPRTLAPRRLRRPTLLVGWQRMVLVHDPPRAVDFAQTHCQSKFESFPLAVRTDASALSYRRGESNILAASDLHLVEVKGNGLLSPRQKRLPGCHVVIQTPRKERWRHIEHQNVRVVIRSDGRPVRVADRLGPSVDKSVDLRLIVRCFGLVACHG